MGLLEVGVTEARALLDEDAMSFSVDFKLEGGTTITFTSTLDESLLRQVKSAMGAKEEPPAKPKRRRPRKPKADAE